MGLGKLINGLVVSCALAWSVFTGCLTNEKIILPNQSKQEQVSEWIPNNNYTLDKGSKEDLEIYIKDCFSIKKTDYRDETKKAIHKLSEMDGYGAIKFLHEKIGLYFNHPSDIEIFADFYTYKDSQHTPRFANIFLHADNLSSLLKSFEIYKISSIELVTNMLYSFENTQTIASLSYEAKKMKQFGIDKFPSFGVFKKAISGWGINSKNKAKLFKKCGITDFGKYRGDNNSEVMFDDSLINELLNSFDPNYRPNDPIALFVWSYHDHNYAFSFLPDNIKSTMKHYKTFVFQVEGDKAINDVIKKVGSKKTIDFPVFSAHGRANLMKYGACGSLNKVGMPLIFNEDSKPFIPTLKKPEDFSMEDKFLLDITDGDMIASWDEYISKDAIILLYGCYCGFGGEKTLNLANTFADNLRGRKIISSKDPIYTVIAPDSFFIRNSLVNFSFKNKRFDTFYRPEKMENYDIPPQKLYITKK